MSLSLLRIRAQSRRFSAWTLWVFTLALVLSGFAHSCAPAEAAVHHSVGGVVVEAGHGEHAAPEHACSACAWQAEAGNGFRTPTTVRIASPTPPLPVRPSVPPVRSLQAAPDRPRGPPCA